MPTATPWNRVGEEVWFRVVGNGQGHDVPDRSTVFGFTPLFEASAAYCAARPWPAGDARTWLVTAGNIQVR